MNPRPWIQRRRRAGGEVWEVAFYLDGRQVTRVAGSHDQAERLRQEVASELAQVRSRRLANRVLTHEFVERYLEWRRHTVAPKSIKDQRETLAMFLRLCPREHLDELGPDAARAFIARRSEGPRPVSRATINKNLRTLRAVFRHAVNDGLMERNPFDGVRRLREAARPIRVLDAAEVRALMDACPDLRWRGLIFLAATTGLRLGELLRLEWQDVDMATGTLTVRSTDAAPTKSGRSRQAPLVPDALALLREMRASAPGPRVFVTDDGTPMVNNVQRDFHCIARRAGVRPCTIHDLRRTFITALQQAGVPLRTVQRLAGHASAETTLRYYTAVMPEDERAAPTRLPYAALGGK
jgi:integrase